MCVCACVRVCVCVCMCVCVCVCVCVRARAHKTNYFAKIIATVEPGTPQGQFLKNNFLITLANHNPINNIC